MITILNGGTQTTLQDAGRAGHRHLGIPGSGAADKLSFALANHLAGNPWDMPALECSLGGLHLRFMRDTVIGIAGAEMWAQINGQNLANFTSVPVKTGDILTLSFARHGVRSYIAVAGGLEGAVHFGSRSTYPPAALGGIEGRALRAGDELTLKDPIGERRKIPHGLVPYLSSHVILRARPAPEFETLTAESRRHLFVSAYIATPQTDRMGARLRGNKVELEKPLSMTSSPLLPGTLQLPPHGQPILALIDGHCTGGYARCLQVVRADLWQMGQIGPGTQVSFRRCFLGEDERALSSRNEFYGGLMPGFSF